MGQNTWESVKVIQKGGNHGWNRIEGSHCFNPDDPSNPSAPQTCDKTGLLMLGLGAVERFVFRRALEGQGGLLLPAVLLGALAAAVVFALLIVPVASGGGSSVVPPAPAASLMR